MTASQSKYTGWLVHVTVWAVIFGMPLFVTGPNRPLMTGSQYIRFLLVPLSFMVVFYTNYFLLIDRYLTSRRFGRFTGYNLLLIGAVMLLVHLLFRQCLIQLLDEKALSAHLVQASVKDFISGGFHGDQLKLKLRMVPFDLSYQQHGLLHSQAAFPASHADHFSIFHLYSLYPPANRRCPL